MKNSKDFEYKFSIDEDQAENSPEFEDIVSDSGMKNAAGGEGIALSSFSAKGHYTKKPRGIKGWWRNRKSWQKAVMITAVSVLLVFCLLFGIVKIFFDYNYNNITSKPEDLGFENVIDKNIVNVALFGIDTRTVDSFKGHSDSIMILSLNTVTKKVKIISVMRDTLVPMTYNGKTSYGKINSAYYRGGPELAIKTINKVFGLDISEYATVNFYGMVDIIDAVGGIDAELTEAEVQKSDGTKRGINGCIDEICGRLNLNAEDYHIYTSGKHHLNGVQAVAYSRIRYVANIWGTNNDYGRTDRQRYVMEQLFNKALTLDKSKYVKLAKSLIPCSETSLSYKEIMGLAFDILLDSPTFEQTRMPQSEYQMTAPSGYGSVVYYDLDFGKAVIHAFIYNDITPEAYVEAHGIGEKDWYRDIFGYYKPSTPDDGGDDEPPVSSEEPGDPDENGDDTPSEPTDPEDPGDETPSEPTDPENPGDETPSEPTDPENPGEDTPSEPTDPENPGDGEGGDTGGETNTPPEGTN